MGKLEQARNSMFLDFKKQISQLGSQQPQLESDIARIIDISNTQALENVDPRALQDSITNMDATEIAQQLQTRAESLVMQSWFAQGVFAVGSLLSVPLGIPFGAALVSWGCLVFVGLGWTGMRWDSLRNQYIQKSVIAQKQVLHEITNRYQKELSFLVTLPLSHVLKLTEDAIESHLVKVVEDQRLLEKQRAELEELKKSLNGKSEP